MHHVYDADDDLADSRADARFESAQAAREVELQQYFNSLYPSQWDDAADAWRAAGDTGMSLSEFIAADYWENVA